MIECTTDTAIPSTTGPLATSGPTYGRQLLVQVQHVAASQSFGSLAPEDSSSSVRNPAATVMNWAGACSRIEVARSVRVV